jgi:glycosyltransferase involved in cell wall biosynthesis
MIRVMHLIVGLNTGGAETNLHRLVKTMDKSRFENIVVMMLPASVGLGTVGQAIAESGVPVLSLDIDQNFPDPLAVIRLARLLRKWKPDLLQTWMYHADLLGGITSKLFAGPPVMWNIRNSDIKRPRDKHLTLLILRVCALLSSWLPQRIVSCSNAGLDFHLKIGYAKPRMVVVFNGYDPDHFRPDQKAAETLKAELGVSSNAKLVVNAGRYHPVKDHRCFLAAARLVRDEDNEAFFVLCGDGITWDNAELVNEIDRLNLRPCVFLLGRRTDLNLILAAAAAVVSSSRSEGFPNVVAEAMACGAICIATDVGDSRHIIGETGFVVPPNRPEELAARVVGALRAETLLKGAMPSGRERIVSLFSIRATVEKYERLYEDTVAARRRRKKGTSAAERLNHAKRS